MMNDMNIKFFGCVGWVITSFYLLCLLLIALYYQYSLGFEPCQICVQIRAIIFVSLIITSSMCCFYKHRWLGFIAWFSVIVLLSAGLALTHNGLLIESGRVVATCSFDGGFPKFLPLDSWLPQLFGVGSVCGASPSMLFGLSMMEWLVLALVIPLIFGLIYLAMWVKHSIGKK